MRSAPQNFTIGKLATAAGVPTTTVRYYERVGLLTPDARTGRNYRSYTAATLERLQFIRTAQSAGLSLDDVANVIRLADEDGVPCAAVQAIMRQRLAQIEQRLAELQSVKSAVESALRDCQCAPRAGLCAEMGKIARA